MVWAVEDLWIKGLDRPKTSFVDFVHAARGRPVSRADNPMDTDMAHMRGVFKAEIHGASAPIFITC